MSNKYTQEDIRYLVRDLKNGVRCERHGDMEPDIFSAEDTMREAAEVIKYLYRECTKATH